ncbi:hypothetical protein WI25_12680 [Burkholderia cepacia]|uniref:hypothetical protein n=1 Tax=Burkholderia cepacia TaxID=292 RepID=UPI00075D6CCB|nr:hypothetical protein [Burkholderia cepacia]KUY72674.1 hypothetical protein WI25_12680 [Burkholderia cepacia]
MNVVVDYPEDFPLVGVDRKVFDHRLRDLFVQPDSYAAHTLDKLRERIGLKSRYNSGDYDELETLFTLVRTDPDSAVRDQLLLRAGDFLLVHLRLAEFPAPRDAYASTNSGELYASGSRNSLRWIVAAASALFVPAAVAAIVWGAPAAASVIDWIIGPSARPHRSVPIVATITPPASGTAANVARPANEPASTVPLASIDGTTELTLTTWTRDPLKAVDGIKRLLPKLDGNEYQIDVTVSRTARPFDSTNTGDAPK